MADLKIMAMIPTYDESGNIRELIEGVLAQHEKMEVVVVDDDSPDGTWRIVDAMASDNPRVHLVHRKEERGRGSAGIAGLKYALECNADYIIEMDGDFSHHPRFIPSLLSKAGEDTVVIGSRLIDGGGEAGRGLFRKWVTLLANLYIRAVLNLPVRDCTSGYRVFSKRVLRTIKLDEMHSNGPAIVQEILVACKDGGFSFVEVPIIFEQRRVGESTFNARIMLAGLWATLMFRFQKVRKKERSS